MVSTLKVNKIQIPNSDSDVISLDASTGNITLNKILGGTSITVQGEGTATTSLQQGLSNHWISVHMGTGAVNDSFNAASITDNGVGDFTNSLTNPMANAHYANTIGSLYVAAWGQIGFFRSDSARTTTIYRTGSVNYHNNGNAKDSPQFDTSIDGDLA